MHLKLRRFSPYGMMKSSPGGWAVVVTPFAILAATAFYVHAHWSAIPPTFPRHWTLKGVANGWSHKTWRGVYGLLLISASVNIAILVSAVSILEGSSHNSEWSIRFRRATLRLMVAAMWITSAIFSGLAAAPLFPALGKLRVYILVLLPVMLALIGVFAYPLFAVAGEPGEHGDETPDDGWKLGMVYYNPTDPALVVESRFGVGYTPNLGNKLAWPMVAFILMVPITVLFIVWA